MINPTFFLRYFKGRCHGSQFCGKITYPPISLSFWNRNGYRCLNVCINSLNDASILHENCVKFGPVTPELTAHLWTSGTTRPKNWRSLSNISGYTEPIFTIFSPYESALRVDDGSVRYFSICWGMLPWQPNNVAVMMANWYYVHSLHVCQMAADGLFARHCHAFLVYHFFSARGYAKRGICRRRVSVCVSVCRSHSGIVSKCSTSCKKMKIGPVVFELNRGRKWKLCCDSAEIWRSSPIWHACIPKRIWRSQFWFLKSNRQSLLFIL